MSTETAVVVRTTKDSVALRLAERYGVDQAQLLSTIKATCMPAGAAVSDSHFLAFLLVADQYNLNPLTRQIYAFPSKGGGIVPIVGVDGWYYLANTHPQYDGFEQEVVRDTELGTGIKTTIHRKDRSHATAHTAWLNECKRPTDPWKMPMRMLGHKSFIQAARMAFSLAGIYDEDEAERFIDAPVATSKPAKSRVAQLEEALTAPLLPHMAARDVALPLRMPAASKEDQDQAVMEAVYAEGTAAELGASCPYEQSSDAEALDLHGAWTAGYLSTHEPRETF